MPLANKLGYLLATSLTMVTTLSTVHAAGPEYLQGVRHVRDLSLANRHVLVRADLNVPLADGHVRDDLRIRSALPTIKHAVAAGAKVILMSHLGRPKGAVHDELRMKPVGERLWELLRAEGVEATVSVANDTVGSKTLSLTSGMKPGQIVLLENTRFHDAETKNDPAFSASLAELAPGGVYVNDAFGTAHRAHASTVGVAQHFGGADKAAGFLMFEELAQLSRLWGDDIERPYVALLGGAKVSGKIDVISSLLKRVDTLLLGGGIANTLLKALGHDVGNSLVDESLDSANAALALAAELGFHIGTTDPGIMKAILLPADVRVGPTTDAPALSPMSIGHTLGDQMIVDIGPKATDVFKEVIGCAGTVFWNGPMGVFENPAAPGTREMANAIAAKQDGGAFTVVGGGDSAAAVRGAGVADRISHVSTGGGASLKVIEGASLPALDALRVE